VLVPAIVNVTVAPSLGVNVDGVTVADTGVTTGGVVYRTLNGVKVLNVTALLVTVILLGPESVAKVAEFVTFNNN
jgi:hypothetical protein